MVTDQGGMFSISGESTSTSSRRFTVSASGFVTRQTTVLVGTDRVGITIDLIRDAAPFSLNFFRQIARDSSEQAGTLLPLARPTAVPIFYIVTVDARVCPNVGCSPPEFGQDTPQTEINWMSTIIRRLVPRLSAGRFQSVVIESGRERPTLSEGRVVIQVVSDPNYPTCGTQSSLRLILVKRNCGCNPNYSVNPHVFAHELGHVMGLRHHTDVGIMSGRGISCSWTPDDVTFTSQEEFHAGVLYSRPPGNTDPDRDPDDFRF